MEKKFLKESRFIEIPCVVSEKTRKFIPITDLLYREESGNYIYKPTEELFCSESEVVEATYDLKEGKFVGKIYSVVIGKDSYGLRGSKAVVIKERSKVQEIERVVYKETPSTFLCTVKELEDYLRENSEVVLRGSYSTKDLESLVLVVPSTISVIIEGKSFELTEIVILEEG